ncbi:MAG: COG1470 family protein [Candidatus Bathyarchaeia archaeon]
MKRMYLKVSLYLILVLAVGVSIAYAGIPYDVLRMLRFGARVNVVVTESASFNIYTDEACTRELVEPINFGSVPRGGRSSPHHIYIKNTGTIPGTISDVRTDVSGFKILWGSSGSTTLHPGDSANIWLRLQVESDVPTGLYNFTILIEIGGGTPESW